MTLDIPTQFPHGIFLASIPLSQTWFPVLMNIQNTILLALQNIQPAPAPLPTPAPAPASPKEIGTKPLVFTGESHDLQRFHQECDLYLTLNSGVYNIVDKKIMLIISLLGPGLPMIWKTSWLDSKINRQAPSPSPPLSLLSGPSLSLLLRTKMRLTTLFMTLIPCSREALQQTSISSSSSSSSQKPVFHSRTMITPLSTSFN